MHKVISNTTPILSLLKIDKLILLKELYGKIIIPEAVFKEIETGKEKPYYQTIFILCVHNFSRCNLITFRNK
jgi:hypothetical protein